MNDRSLYTVVFAIGVSVTLSVVASNYIINKHFEALQTEMPLIAVAGYNRIEKRIEESGSTEFYEKSINDMNLKISKLIEQGYLVIDERVIISTPDHLLVPILKESTANKSKQNEEAKENE